MYKPRIIPCLLLRGNSLVKTIKFSNDVYIGDPVNAIRIFNEKEVDELVILDIEASLHSKDPNYELIEEMASEAFMPVAYGGGITKLSQAKHLIRAGIEKIVLNSSITVNPELMVQISETFGKQAIIASVDVRKSIFKGYKAYTHSGTKEVKESLNEYIEKIVSLGAGELLNSNFLIF